MALNPIEPPVDHFLLEKIRVGSRISTSSYFWQHAEIARRESLDHIMDQLIYTLESEVLQDKLPPVTVEETAVVDTEPVPATWWDHFKQDYKGKWFFGWLDWCKEPQMISEGREVTLKVDLERWINYPEAQNIPDTFGRQVRGHRLVYGWTGL